MHLFCGSVHGNAQLDSMLAPLPEGLAIAINRLQVGTEYAFFLVNKISSQETIEALQQAWSSRLPIDKE
jgi:hypothetical protein